MRGQPFHICRPGPHFPKRAWCGEKIPLQNESYAHIDHAVLTMLNAETLNVQCGICPTCVDVIVDALRAGKGETT